MDVETSEAIEQIGQRIDALEASLRAEFRAGYSQSRQYTEAVFAENRRHTEGLVAETRRHIEVLLESVRDDIRLLAEGFATISAKLNSRR